MLFDHSYEILFSHNPKMMNPFSYAHIIIIIIIIIIICVYEMFGRVSYMNACMTLCMCHYFLEDRFRSSGMSA
jgi:hypothetical protein